MIDSIFPYTMWDWHRKTLKITNIEVMTEEKIEAWVDKWRSEEKFICDCSFGVKGDFNQVHQLPAGSMFVAALKSFDLYYFFSCE